MKNVNKKPDFLNEESVENINKEVVIHIKILATTEIILLANVIPER